VKTVFIKYSAKFVFIFSIMAIFLAILTASTTSVLYLESSDWGLLSRFPITYWLGLSFVCVVAVINACNHFSRIQHSVLLLFLFFLYIHFLPMYVEKVIGLSIFSFWPSSESMKILDTGHIPIGDPVMLMDYTSWPFFSIFFSIFMNITGIPLIVLSKWFPLFTVLFWGLIVFLFSRKYLGNEYALVSFILFFAMSWTRQQYFGPQSFALSLFFIFLLLITKSTKFGIGLTTRSCFGLAFITFVAVLFSHSLTSLILIMVLITSYFVSNLLARSQNIKNRYTSFFVLFCLITLIAYIIYVAPMFFEAAFYRISDTFGDLSGLKTIQQLNRLPGSQIQQTNNVITFLIFILLLFVSSLSFIWVIIKKNMPRIQITFWLSFLLVLGLVAFLPYGAEGPFRAYIFGLPLFCCLSIYFLKKKPLLLCCFIILSLLLCIPALYGADSTKIAPSVELSGGRFCSTYLPDDIYLFYRLSPYVRYYNPAKVISFTFLGQPPFVNYSLSNVANRLIFSDYIVMSRSQLNYYVYYIGENPFEKIDLVENRSISSGLIYNNGNFTLYDSKGR
jgi:hypothetical protein